MPDFKLSNNEAKQLAAYLRQQSSKTLTLGGTSIKGDITKGKKSFVDNNCLQCHHVTGLTSHKTFPKIFTADANLSKTHSAQFDLTKDDVLALNAFMKTSAKSLESVNPSEYAKDRLNELNCTQCHSLHDQKSNWIGMTGPLAITPPDLSNVGEKLLPHALKEILNGSLKTKTRPWMHGRMPSFKAQAELMAKGLNERQGFHSKVYEKHVAQHDNKMADLIKAKCITCHSLDNIKSLIPPGPTSGINLKQTGNRIRKEYLIRWMNNPQRINPITRMPRFSSTDINFEDLYSYLRSINEDFDYPTEENNSHNNNHKAHSVQKVSFCPLSILYWLIAAALIDAVILASILRNRR